MQWTRHSTPPAFHEKKGKENKTSNQRNNQTFLGRLDDLLPSPSKEPERDELVWW
jgi:hypothetical protein